jgi:triacylglycerol lipase
MNMRNALAAAGAAALAAGLSWAAAHAEPPADVYDKLVKIGRVVDAPGTTAIYGPILANQSYKGANFTRNIKYADGPRAVLDVASPSERPKRLVPVLIYVPGGGGNNHLDYAGGGPFLDNVMLTAIHNGMVGVNMQRQAGPNAAWDSGAQDISAVVQWVHDNIEKYGGDPNRIAIWGQSAGANNLSNYLTHKQYWTKGGIGVKAAVIMSGGYNLAPLTNTVQNSARGPGDGGAAAIRAAAANPAPAGPPPVDPAVRLQRSNLPGFRALKIKTMVAAAGLDPEATVEASKMLRDVMTKAGNKPAYLMATKQSHMSEIIGLNSDDKEVEGPVYAWLKRTL